jgi:hypothetical protein
MVAAIVNRAHRRIAGADAVEPDHQQRSAARQQIERMLVLQVVTGGRMFGSLDLVRGVVPIPSSGLALILAGRLGVLSRPGFWSQNTIGHNPGFRLRLPGDCHDASCRPPICRPLAFTFGI